MPEPTPPTSFDNQDADTSLETLESEDNTLTVIENNSASDETDNDDKSHSRLTALPSTSGRFRLWLRRFNVYLLLFIFVLLLAGAIIILSYVQNKKVPAGSQLQTQTLSQKTLDKLATSDTAVGSNNQILTVESSAIFTNKVLVRKDVEVAGNLQIGGTVGLTNLSVAGTSQFGQLQINKNLSVAGDTGIQGNLTVAKSLQVSGSGSFGTLSATQINTSNLQLNGDLTLSHHIKTTGAAPGHSSGTALGGGGTTTVSGSDISGTVTVNTGSNPPAGCFVTINFTSRYDNTPRVLLTPLGAASGGLTYYVSHTPTSFSICDATPAPAGASFGFDYFVIE